MKPERAHASVSRRRFLRVALGTSIGSALFLPASGWRNPGRAAETGVREGEPRVISHRADAGAPTTRKPLPPTRLLVPAIELDSPVTPLGVHYDNAGQLIWETAAFVAGHYTNTSNAGEQGNCVLSGHISSRSSGAVFRRLPEVQAGDGVVVGTAESMFLYQVVQTQVVDPRATEVMLPGSNIRLTLITCVPDGIYSHRLIVTATLI